VKENPLRMSCTCNLLTPVIFQVQHEFVHIQGAFLRFIPFKWLAFKAGGLQIKNLYTSSEYFTENFKRFVFLELPFSL
jgi:hypothetical protein